MALMGFLVAGCGLLTLAAPFRFSMARVTIFLGLTLLVLTSDLFAPTKGLEDQGKQIGLFLRTAFGDRHPLLVSDAAGAVPFYAEMSAIDPQEPRDGKSILDHKPDILLLANDRGSAFFLADQQLLADPRFASHYQLIHIDAGPPAHNRADLYIRRIDGRIGIESVGDIVTVPGYLAKIDDANSVRLIDGKAQLVIAPHGSAQFTAIPLVAGNWIATFEGAGAVQLSLRNAQRSRDCPGCVQSDQSGSATVTIENTSDQPAILT
ncbi:MAG TPA: hypothetical protein VKB76_06820, partial [Ktedonobacterales bacterium]|nr:hypothetical protein [Ktedonobacterales bacterium]